MPPTHGPRLMRSLIFELCILLSRSPDEAGECIRLLELLFAYLSELKQSCVPEHQSELSQLDSLFHIATASKDLALIHLLADKFGADVNSVLGYSVRVNKAAVDHDQRNEVCRTKLSPLHIAIFVGSIETVRALIAMGAVPPSVNYRDYIDPSADMPSLYDWIH